MNTLEFEIRTKPVPQARPRFYVKQKGARQIVGAYDPKKCKTFKEVVAWEAKIKAMETGLRNPVTAPIALSLVFQMGKNGKEKFHTKRPDVDNLSKAVKDALTGIIYKDDSQIVEAHLYKTYGDHCIKVKIEALEG